MSLIRRILQNKLGVSEPNPSWFGNPRNEVDNGAWTNKNWLKSRFHFSFAEYNNPDNTNFGVLRVMNDDLVQPKRGFGEHPHRDAEICTYVVEGALTHKDSMGTKETISRGAVQFMTAGQGITHSEHNLHDTDPLRFIQIWITPRRRGLRPNYGSYSSTPEDRLNQWAHLVSDVNDQTSSAAVKINQDANIYVSEIEPGRELLFPLRADRQAYFLCMEGSVAISGSDESTTLSRHDSAELYGSLVSRASTSVDFVVSVPSDQGERSHVLIVEMLREGTGRTDL